MYTQGMKAYAPFLTWRFDVAVEDQGGLPTLETIRHLFGKRGADAVESCSDSTVIDPAKKLPWRQRKEKYLAHLRNTRNNDAVLVAIADKLHNARAILSDYREIGEELWSRFNAPKEDQRLPPRSKARLVQN
jgi:(p)ppGpp synthase/HD superfamily hydrolase